MMPGSAMANHGMPVDSEPIPVVPGDADSDQPQKPSDAEFPSMFSDAKAIAKRFKKTNERK